MIPQTYILLRSLDISYIMHTYNIKLVYRIDWFVVSELLVCGIRVTGLWYQSYWFVVSELLVCSIRVTGLWYQSYWFVVSELLACGIRVTGL
jgi:hypothetical protein